MEELLEAQEKSMSEHQHQTEVVNWLEERGHVVFAVPNGFNKSYTARLKADREGLRSGVPDLLIITPSPVRNKPVALEMKKYKGKKHKKCECMSDEQIEWKEKFKHNGWLHMLAHGQRDAIEALERLGY